ncbi:hypothetical protein PATSB16_29080 [Pandoraea thiooxydans]|nr:hypothetical protein PATSB16_29080 [Pandoraea thiooxydans]
MPRLGSEPIRQTEAKPRVRQSGTSAGSALSDPVANQGDWRNENPINRF